MKKLRVHGTGPVIVPKHMRRRHDSSPMGFLDKTFLLVTLIAVAYVLIIIYQKQILALLQKNPYVWAGATHIFAEINGRTLLGLFYASFFGSLFFIMIPLELLFLYYATLGYPGVSLVGLAVIAIAIGLSLDYLFGWLVGKRVLVFILRDKFEKFHKWINKWGAIAIFFGAATPFPIQPVSVIIGAVGYSMKKFIIFAVAGLLAKYIGLFILSGYLMEYLVPWLQGMF
jgi:membrane protein DedA with SNARE-associated domain